MPEGAFPSRPHPPPLDIQAAGARFPNRCWVRPRSDPEPAEGHGQDHLPGLKVPQKPSETEEEAG